MSAHLSLVMATLGRSSEIKRYLDQLVKQTFEDWELIVVDQNKDDRVTALLATYPDPRIRRITSSPGAARARNAGLAQAVGDIVAFPDDDCWYPDDQFLSRATSWFDAEPGIDFISGATGDPDRGVIDKWLDSECAIARKNVWFTTVCYTLYFRRRTVALIGNLESRLGVGAGTLWGSGEETDYVLRALAAGATGRYHPELVTYHPNKGAERSDGYLLRTCLYAMGAGAVMRKNHLPLRTAFYFSARSAFGAVRAKARGDRFETSRYLVVLLGRIVGWLTWQPDPGPPRDAS